MRRKRKVRQYELHTSMNKLDMPFQIHARSFDAAFKFVKKRLRKGEKIISLKRSYW